MASLTKRKNASPQKSSGNNNNKNPTQTVASKKKQKQKKLHGLAAQDMTRSKIRNKLFLAVIIYILAGAGFLYWRGVSTSSELPPEVENEILDSYPQDVKHIEMPKNLKKPSGAGPAIEEKTQMNSNEKMSKTAPKSDKGPEKQEKNDDFQVHIQNSIKPQPMSATKQWKEIKYSKNSTASHVRIFTMDDFLSPHECDGLMKAHASHVKQHSQHHPIICFSGETTMKEYLKHFKISWVNKVSENDFTEGTYCLNETLSSKLDGKLLWSKSTSFYPGESPFSTRYSEQVEKYTGLDQRNGGKFQVTSYPENVGYKLHTDCTIENPDTRDRYATILVYLNDVVKGGETEFTELGIKIKPKKGKALLWNNMDTEGHCDVMSHHQAASVKIGKKYILQRWYYYQNFPALGLRTPAPKLPLRSHELTPRVSCDRYDSGSCRWYDEWNYDHLIDYRKMHL
uniref:Uncharacterized protein LOC100175515 n=1 Tax=Phallusia mammillata TaxID=59560 RepID=A0A6F9DGY4_9ASCI|nr:uncharacterized protein LOC100175515 [Phallusia mammillata]